MGYVLVVAGYVFLAIGSVPRLCMNRATIALVTTAGLIALGVLSLDAAWRAIDGATIIFLLSMMIINAYLSYAGFFQISFVYIISLSRSPFGLITLLTFGTGLLSAVFLNDTLALVATPLTLQLARTLGLNPVPYLLAIAGATNIGSVATLNGNPQNILIGTFSQISYLEFFLNLIPVTLLGLVCQIGLLLMLYPEVRSLQPSAVIDLPKSRVHKPLLLKSLTVAIALLMAFVVGLPLAESAFMAAAILLITRRIKPSRVLSTVDWSLLVVFSGLFILTKALQSLDIVPWLGGWVQEPWGLVTVTALLSNLISNVPAVLLLKDLIDPNADTAWLLLAASSTLAGNLTLFGSVANLIMVEAVAAQGGKLTFWEHLRFGLPLTLLLLAIAYGWITMS